MNEADFKTAVAIIKTGTEPGVPVGEIEGRVCAALPGITDKDLEAAFERAADEFRAQGDASFTEADGLRQFKERRRNTLNSEEESMTEAEVDPLPPDLMHRYLIYMQECFPLLGGPLGPPTAGSPWDRQLAAATMRWWSELSADEHERVLRHFVEHHREMADRMATIIIEQTATQWGIPLPEKPLNRRSTRKRTTAKNPGRGKATHASLLLMAHIREVAHRRFSRCAALRGFVFLLRESAGAGPRPVFQDHRGMGAPDEDSPRVAREVMDRLQSAGIDVVSR
jgi:hypothetical protein